MDAFISAGQSNQVRNEDNLEAAIREAYPGAVLIRTAVSGSWIKSWNPGGKNYENALTEIYAYQLQNYTIKALLFNQGEADTRVNMAGAAWVSLYWNFLDHLWDEVGYTFPAVHSILGPPPVDEIPEVLRPNWMLVHQAQLQASQRANSYAIGEWDIPRLPNDVHYSQAGYMTITNRYMSKLAQIL